eukprot:TRINITY_DN10726_c1_g3_i1.p2 TRINITY_DN10726_c1_g3~~TRINITY_DN10726_c1_g3_i1.p2  ORF type:complete len:1220 (-),score=308.30 TRINITY_DN10726_c1_g3_i1:801-4439(-)
MHLYNLTLQKPSAITCAIYGSFTAPKMQEIVVARGAVLELLRPDENGHMVTICTTDVFGIIRSLAPFRLTGGNRDYVVVGSDSGRVTILEYSAQLKQWKRCHMETFGKTGIRRIVPGQYIAVDPRGRALMVAAVDKQKFVYILNRDASNNLTISSPLEAHKSHSIVFSVCGVDVGFDNPVFATIEVDYSELDDDPEAEQPVKQLVYYELDLGLNHVLRKWSTPVDQSANLLIPVPGGSDGPSGVLVCSENYITFKHNSAAHVTSEGIGTDNVRAVIPRRQDMSPDQGLLIVSFAAHKQKDMFFFLVQSEYGDIYKVAVEWQETEAKRVTVKYFDTIPCTNALAILRAGFLFACSEFSNHRLYQFQGIGDDEDDCIIGYMTIGEEGDDEENQEVLPLFRPRPLKNLLLIDDIDSLSPVLDSHVEDLMREGAPQIYALCGRGPQSSLRVLRHGLAVSELAVSELPGVPNAVWTVKKRFAEQFDDYIVVAFLNATLVLSIGETVEEVTDSGFLGNVTTLLCGTLNDDSMVQVHPHGIRHVRRDGRINEWKAAGKRPITKAACNEKQVVVAQGNDLLYFELDLGGSLVDVARQDFPQDVLCLDLGPVPEGRQRSKFVAVAFPDRTIRVLALEGDLSTLSTLMCTVEAESLCMVNMPSETGEVHDNTYLFVGLANGMLQRCTVDQSNGQITDPRTRLCGVRGCRLMKVRAQGNSSVLVLSSRTWLCYSINHKFHINPLGQDAFEWAAPFSSEPCPEGLVAISANQVRILAFERISDSTFHQTTVPLKCTPRKVYRHPTAEYLILLETDHRMHTSQEKEDIRRELRANAREDNGMAEEDEAGEDEDGEEEQLPEREFGTLRAPEGRWASYIRIYDPRQGVTHDMIELEDNQAAVSVTACYFHGHSEPYLVVGTAKDLVPNPRTCKGGALLTFRFTDYGRKLELVHKTPTQGAPLALCPFQGRLLVGVDNVLRLYDLGKKKLLRKCENKNFPSPIVSIIRQVNRIFVADTTESIHYVRYKRVDNQLAVFADNTSPRWITCMCPLDYRTVAGADKFGNFFVSRLPEGANEDVDAESKNWMWERGVLNGAPNKSEEIVKYYIGDVVTSLKKTPLAPGGVEVVMYTTVMGTIGVFVPLASRDDVDFFTQLEMLIRQESPPLCGRDHQAYRSYTYPVKDVFDGDYCETYMNLPYTKQLEIARHLDRAPEDVCKRLEDMRHKIL